jgi:murein DD-endopeptidase MepM/ murein hydrolase activator NlpD
MSKPWRDPRSSAVAERVAASRLALALVLMAGTAGCTASPQYPINMGERAGDGTIMANQPRYPVSRADAARNARDRAAYPDYNAPPRPAAAGQAYGAPAPAAAPPVSDDPTDDAPRPVPQSSVESSDLPPAGPAAPPSDAAAPMAPPPSNDGAAGPHTISWGGGSIVFGSEPVGAPVLEFAAYHHHRRKAAAAAKDDSDPPAESGAKASAGQAGDTPYQTVVRPGEKLGDVAERTHSSRDALVQLNDLKHPKHVKAGTVLKLPYRYAYEVQKGDTLYTISHRFNQDPAAIAKLNGLKTVPTLQPGQALTLPTDASDNGKRDHAAASGPVPVAAPEKLADAALKKAEKRDRRHHRRDEAETAAAAEPAPSQVAAAEPAPAHETRRERRRREREERQAARLAAAEPRRLPPAMAGGGAAAEVASDAGALRPSPEPVRPSPEPLRPSPEPVPAAVAPLRPSPEPVRPAAVATAAPHGPSFVPPATSAAATGAPVATTSTYAAASAQPAPAYGYPRVASLTPPRYTPGSPTGAYEPSLGRARAAEPVAPAGPVSSSEVATAGRGRFIWPLRGQVVSPFGLKGSGQNNDGLDIAASPGTGVRAAASGEVVYAGSSIPGFGNLILVKHPGGWVTAYAHLDRIEVRMRDTVAQGQEIGLSGQTGAVDRPLLHFEIRYAPDPTEKARPVDPALLLPTG